jgi:Phosphatidylinositol-4-phosphate 5-Kinase
MFGVNEFDFLLSVCGNANFIEFISNAKSGQFFFYSSDGKYMVKTMTNAESKFLRRILPHYFRHCSQNPNTMMTKFLGMYRVKLYHLRRNVKFVIMNSVYYTDKFLQSFYDLKGSVTGRDSKPGQDVKKDNDLRLGLPESSLALPPDVRSRILEQITSDCEFMSRMKIMDYSMLVGIHHIPPKRGISSERSIGNSGFRFSAERRESRSSLRDVVKRTAVGSPVISSLAGKSGDGSIVSVQGTAPPNLSLDDASLSDHHVHFSEGSNVSGDQQKVAGVKQNPNSSVTPSDKDDLSTIGGNSRTSEDHSSMLAMSMYEFALDDDDDNSYLEGSVNHPVVMPTMGTAGASKMAELAVKKEQTTENVYWPFHRYYDLNGYRRMIPCRCTKCGVLVPCSCEEDKASRQGFKIPDFVLPLSDRKDGGLTMDTTGFKMPMKLKGPNGRDQHYDGKIFYMGIIDILQQYNIRKRIEARYRRIKGSGWKDASCVHPSVYAERFIAFFDEYSQRSPTATETPLQKGEEAIVFYDPKRDNEDTKEEIELTRVEYPMEIGDETVAITINKHLKTE